MTAAIERFDIAIVGAGIVGLATALAVLGNPGPRPRVIVCDPALAPGHAPARTLRAVAIAPASRRFLERIGVWAAVAAAAGPIEAMVLTDTRPGAVPAPDLLHFAREQPGQPLAHMVVQDDLRAALLAACAARGVVLRGDTTLAATPAADALELGGGTPIRARLVIAADGGRSRLREAAGIRTVGRDYDQSAIVATLAHSRDHRGEAIQHFMPGGPLALLPMRAEDGSGRRSSIVWTERTDEVARLLALPAAGFCAALQARIGYERGMLTLEDTPGAHPLRLRLARGLVGARLALAGDAARTIHPLAGQGLNLGLQDAEALGRRTAVFGLGLDPGSPRVLDAYQRDRRAAQVALAATTDALNALFSNDHTALRAARDIGLGLVDRAPALKRMLIRQAAGGAPEGTENPSQKAADP